MMLNVLAHHLFETDLQGNDDGINGAPPPATQAIIDNLKETPALEMHIGKYKRMTSKTKSSQFIFSSPVKNLVYIIVKHFESF